MNVGIMNVGILNKTPLIARKEGPLQIASLAGVSKNEDFQQIFDDGNQIYFLKSYRS